MPQDSPFPFYIASSKKVSRLAVLLQEGLPRVSRCACGLTAWPPGAAGALSTLPLHLTHVILWEV